MGMNAGTPEGPAKGEKPMPRQIFVNLPVKSLARSVSFFEGLGFRFSPEFTDEKGTCMIVDDNIFVMLLTEGFFGTFTSKRVCDAKSATEVLVCLSCETRAEVDELVARAVAGGGQAPRPSQDHGFMYQHGFEDPDGHVWELVHMQGAPS
jgi:predicted lactoylglutathione lyase